MAKDLGHSHPETQKVRSLTQNIRLGTRPNNSEKKFLLETLHNYCPKSRIDVKDLSSIFKRNVVWEGGVESDLYNFLSSKTQTEGKLKNKMKYIRKKIKIL